MKLRNNTCKEEGAGVLLIGDMVGYGKISLGAIPAMSTWALICTTAYGPRFQYS